MRSAHAYSSNGHKAYRCTIKSSAHYPHLCLTTFLHSSTVHGLDGFLTSSPLSGFRLLSLLLEPGTSFPWNSKRYGRSTPLFKCDWKLSSSGLPTRINLYTSISNWFLYLMCFPACMLSYIDIVMRRRSIWRRRTKLLVLNVIIIHVLVAQFHPSGF